jgi:hypothetical protein
MMVLQHILAVLCEMFSITYVYHDRWIGRGGTAWPPRSPDLNPLDVYLWGHLKALEYVAPADNEVALHHGILDTCQSIRNYPGIFERMRRSMMRRVEGCIESHGGHSEHLLQVYYFSYNSQIKCFRTHVNMDIFSFFGMCNSCPKFVLTFPLLPVYPIINSMMVFYRNAIDRGKSKTAIWEYCTLARGWNRSVQKIKERGSPIMLTLQLLFESSNQGGILVGRGINEKWITQFRSGNLHGRNYLEDLGVNESIILIGY